MSEDENDRKASLDLATFQRTRANYFNISYNILRKSDLMKWKIDPMFYADRLWALFKTNAEIIIIP